MLLTERNFNTCLKYWTKLSKVFNLSTVTMQDINMNRKNSPYQPFAAISPYLLFLASIQLKFWQFIKAIFFDMRPSSIQIMKAVWASQFKSLVCDHSINWQFNHQAFIFKSFLITFPVIFMSDSFDWFQGVLEGSGNADRLPTVLVVAHYDSMGAAPVCFPNTCISYFYVVTTSPLE